MEREQASLCTCVCESVACKAGSLASHCDPDSNCSPEIEGGREGRRYRERVEIERDKENGSETGKRRERRSES